MEWKKRSTSISLQVATIWPMTQSSKSKNNNATWDCDEICPLIFFPFSTFFQPQFRTNLLVHQTTYTDLSLICFFLFIILMWCFVCSICSYLHEDIRECETKRTCTSFLEVYNLSFFFLQTDNLSICIRCYNSRCISCKMQNS